MHDTQRRILSAEEMQQLTGKKRFKAQSRVLDVMGVQYFQRPDGCPVVTEAALVGKEQATGAQPNFEALNR